MLTAQFIQQTQQANHFWLSEFRLNTSTLLPINLTLDYAETHLQLFSQQNQTLQFLSPKPLINPNLCQISLNNKNPQAWAFLTDFKAKIRPEHTVCLLADETQFGQVFLLAKALKEAIPLVIILATQTQFPFTVKPARFLLDGLPPQAANMIGACPLLEDWGITNRLCHAQGQPGCFDGHLEDFLTLWEAPQNWQLIRLT